MAGSLSFIHLTVSCEKTPQSKGMHTCIDVYRFSWALQVWARVSKPGREAASSAQQSWKHSNYRVLICQSDIKKKCSLFPLYLWNWMILIKFLRNFTWKWTQNLCLRYVLGINMKVQKCPNGSFAQSPFSSCLSTRKISFCSTKIDNISICLMIL